MLRDKIHRKKVLAKIIKDKNHPLREIDIDEEWKLIQQKKSTLPRQTRNLITYMMEQEQREEVDINDGIGNN